MQIKFPKTYCVFDFETTGLDPAKDKIIEIGAMLREDFLQQSAFSEMDAYCPMEKQDGMLKALLAFYHKSAQILKQGGNIEMVLESPLREKIGRLKDVSLKDWKNNLQQVLKEVETWNLQPVTITQ